MPPCYAGRHVACLPHAARALYAPGAVNATGRAFCCWGGGGSRDTGSRGKPNGRKPNGTRSVETKGSGDQTTETSNQNTREQPNKRTTGWQITKACTHHLVKNTYATGGCQNIDIAISAAVALTGYATTREGQQRPSPSDTAATVLHPSPSMRQQHATLGPRAPPSSTRGHRHRSRRGHRRRRSHGHHRRRRSRGHRRRSRDLHRGRRGASRPGARPRSRGWSCP